MSTGAARTSLAGDGLSPGTLVATIIVVAALAVGTPHGAVDVTRLGNSPRRFVAGGILYAASALAAGAVWFVAPLPALLGLLALAAGHFGAGEVELSRHLTRGAVSTRLGRALQIASLGGIPVVLPLGLHGGSVLDILDALTAGNGSVIVTVCRWAIPFVAVAAIGAVALCTGTLRRDITVDVVALGVLFVVLTPLLAFAVYFALWHAWRQSGLLIQETADERDVAPARAGRDLLLLALAPSIVAALAVVVLAVTLETAVIAPALVTVLCLTVPHSILAPRITRPGSGLRLSPR